jgi:anti-sigma B factor antagonist
VGLQISSRLSGPVTVVELHGRVTIGHGNDDLSQRLRELIQAGASNLLIDLQAVPQVDSSGISTLVRFFVTLRRAGGSLKLLRPTGQVHQTLAVTHLLNAIPVFDDEGEAIASFSQPAS